MAHPHGTSARTQRLIAGAATAAVAVAAAVALGRVFDAGAATARLLAAGLASAVIAAALERRSLVLATLVSAAGLAVAIGLLVVPETTAAGLPAAETVRVVVRSIGRVGEQARVQVAPAPALIPLLLAAVAGIWAAVFAAHALAFRAGSPLLALLPPIALVGFADSVLEDLVRPVFGLLFLAAAAALLFADGLRRVQAWGPVWTGPGRAARLDVSTGRGARRVAGAVVAIAAVAPVILPGFGARGLIDFSTTDDDLVRVDPLVSVENSLQRDEEVPVLEVDTPVGRYWRLVALPDFDGRVWRPASEPETLEIAPGTPLATSTQPADSPETVEISFTALSDLALPWLPLPYPPRSTTADLGDMRWDPEGGSIELPNGVEEGTAYTALADVVQPTPDQLRAQPPVASSAETLPYIQVPADLPEAIRRLALDWTAGTDTTYDAVIAIQDRLTDPTEFTYDDQVPGTSSDQAMVEFLFDTKTGFCQQFSSAMAVMLRSIGIPARLAVGFTPGEFDESVERLTVTTENAHSWVEVLFPEHGWLAFEPTPGRQNPLAYPYIDPSFDRTCRNPDGSRCETRRGGAAGGGRSDLGNPAFTTAADRESVRPGGLGGAGLGEGSISGVADASPDPGPLTARRLIAAGLAVAVIGLAVVPPARSWRRRKRLRRAADEPRELVLATYDVFTERAAELGHPRLPGQTLEEYRRSVHDAMRGTDGDLDRLTALATGAAYAPRNVQEGDARAATDASGSVLRAMRREAGWVQRVTGPYRRR